MISSAMHQRNTLILLLAHIDKRSTAIDLSEIAATTGACRPAASTASSEP